jgi:site-specific recombinase XerD
MPEADPDQPFYLIVADHDRGVFAVEGPMIDDPAVERSRDLGPQSSAPGHVRPDRHGSRRASGRVSPHAQTGRCAAGQHHQAATMSDQLPTEISPARVSRMLTAAEFHRLADVPPEVEWFANLSNPSTRRAYENAVKDFMRFTGIQRPEEFRIVTRAHIIAWRDDLVRRGLGGSTIRHRLASLASLFEYLCDKNAVTHNPVKGVERPKTESGEGKTPALGDHQARKLLDAPQAETIKSKRDRAILSTLLFHALRREELCKLKVKDFRHARKGVPHLGIRQRWQDAIPAAASRHQWVDQRLPRRRRPRHGRERRAVPVGQQQSHRQSRTRDHGGRRLQAGAGLLGGTWVRDRRACVARDRRDQCPRSSGRHRQGPGMARPREHRHHPHLRSPENAAGGQPDIQGGVLIWRPGLRLTGQRHYNGLTR